MRKVTQQAIKCLLEGTPFSKDNTKVVITRDKEAGDTLCLHGTPIIKIKGDGVWITTGGWNTLTTKERLNGLRGVSVYNQRKVLHLNGQPWDGSWTKVDVSLF